MATAPRTPGAGKRAPPTTPGATIRSPGAETIQVAVRIRPLLESEKDAGEERAVEIRGANDVLVATALAGAPSKFRLDHIVRPDQGQDAMFAVVQPHLDQALSGFNTTVFAYGQTGTGKTHTMLGVDMWRLAEKGGDGGRADAGLLSGVADAVSSGALQPGTPAYADVVDRLMAYDGDYHPDWGLIPRAMAYVFRRLQIGAAAVATVGGSQRHSPASYSSPASRARRRSTLAPGRASMSPGPGGFGGRLPDGVKVTVTYLEIYNERVYDLLRPPDDDDGPAHGPTPAARSKPAPSLDIVNDPTRGVCVPDAVAVPVTNEAEVLALLWEGARNRVLASTDMNEHSSRSHTIWQVGVERRHRRGAGAGDSPRRVGGDASSPASSGRSGGEAAGTSDLGDGEMVVSRSKVSLVDLAGSEKLRPHAMDAFSGRRLTELTSINQSLSCLGNCVRALASRSRGHIPYRDSKLTRLLQDSLGGNCKTLFVVTLSPASCHVEETMSTLHFADRAKRVEVHAERNETLDDASLARRYKAEASRLRQQLARARSAAGRAQTHAAEATRSAGDGMSRGEAAELRGQLAEAQEEAVRWRAAAARAEEEALAARAARRRVIVAAAKAARESGAEGAERAVRAGLAAADAAEAAAREREARLSDADADVARRSGALLKHFEWMRGLPLVGSGGSGTGPGGRAEARGQTPSSRLALLEGQVQRVALEVRAARSSFLQDVQRLQRAAAEAEAEAEAAAHALSTAHGVVGGAGRSPGHASERADDGEGARLAAEAEARAAARERWSRHTDRTTQRSYWHCRETGETQWERPEGWETEAEAGRRAEVVEVVSAHRGQQGRLLEAVTSQLEEQLSGIAAGDGGLEAALREEVRRFHRETAAALRREVDALAAALGLR